MWLEVECKKNQEQCVYLIPRWLLVVWCGWPRSICVWVCARLHLCACVVSGANDSWHLATISGSLISIERFVGVGVGGVQISLYLTNRCVFDLLTHSLRAHDTHARRSIWRSSLKYGHVYKCLPPFGEGDRDGSTSTGQRRGKFMHEDAIREKKQIIDRYLSTPEFPFQGNMLGSSSKTGHASFLAPIAHWACAAVINVIRSLLHTGARSDL